MIFIKRLYLIFVLLPLAIIEHIINKSKIKRY